MTACGWKGSVATTGIESGDNETHQAEVWKISYLLVIGPGIQEERE